jgi:adhesin/invasin
VGAAVSGTITVTVRTSDNLPVPRTTVSFTTSAGTISSTSAQTDDNGRATAGTWSLGTTAGSQTLTAAAGSASAQLVATAAAATPATIELVTGLPASIRAGVPVTPAPVVRAKDQYANIVNRPGTVITATLQSGAGTLGGAQATTDANGIATFSALTLSGLVSAGPRTIAFTATGLPTVAAPPVALEAGTTATITLQNVPTFARAGVVIAPGVVARLSDAFGNPMSRPTPVTATLAQGSGAIAGNAATTNTLGEATFASLALEGLVGNRQLRFTADQVSATTGSITLAPGDASQLQVTSQPTVVENTIPFPRMSWCVTDRSATASLMPDAGSPRRSPRGVCAHGAAAQTDAVGVARFAGLRLIGSAAAHARLHDGRWRRHHAAIQLDAGPARFVAFFQQPSGTVTVGVPLLQQPALQLADTSGNVVRRAGAPVRATVLDANGELLNDVAITDNQGVARFEQLTFLSANAFPPPTLRLRFSSGAQAAVVTGNLNIQNAPGSGVRRHVRRHRAAPLPARPGGTLSLSAVARDLLAIRCRRCPWSTAR